MVIFFVGMITLQAQESLKVKFRSRALLDATLSGYGKESTQGYYRLEDFRVGFKATYQKFEIKADIGLGGGKVAIKDLLLNYHFKNSVLSFGNGYEPFSMDMLISTADLRFHQSAASVLAFTNSRKLGATYHFTIITGIWLREFIHIMISTSSAANRKMLSYRLRAWCGAKWKKSIGCFISAELSHSARKK